MSRFLLTLTVLVLIAAPATAFLKCYSCIGDDDSCSKSKLEDNKAAYLSKCIVGDRCMRTWDKYKDGSSKVTSSCSSESLCDFAKSACALREDTLKDYHCAVGCCSEDGCNAGSPITINVILLTVFSVLGLALLK